MTTPAHQFSSAREFRESNRRMAESILAAEPAPYADGGYVRRVLEIRGRASGQAHRVPLAVISLAGSRYGRHAKRPGRPAFARLGAPASAHSRCSLSQRIVSE